MKNYKIFSVLTCLPLVVSLPALTWSNSCSKPDTPDVPAIRTSKRINSTFFSADTNAEPPKWVQQPIWAPVYIFNDNGIPYLSVSAYVSAFMQFKSDSNPHGHTYKTTKGDKTITITNEQNNATCEIDFVNQTLTFSDYDAFLNYHVDGDNPMSVGCSGGEELFLGKIDQYVAPSTSYVINLSKYHLTAFWYNDTGYLPYDLYRNIINNNPGDSWFFYDSNFYQLISGYNAKANNMIINLYKMIKSPAVSFSSTYLEFCYNILAITLDNKYGLNKRQSRSSPGTEIQYFPNGAYDVLKPYHSDLVSIQPNVANKALKKFFNEFCDDGGHSDYSGVDILCTTPLTLTYGNETMYTARVFNAMDIARENSKYYTGGGRYEHGFPEKMYDFTLPDTYLFSHRIDFMNFTGNPQSDPPDTIWLTFDSFDSVFYADAYKEFYPEIYNDFDNVDGLDGTIEYYWDTICTTMYLQKVFSSNLEIFKNIKNLFIDLTNNGGGVVFAEHFLASYLCGNHNTCEPQNSLYQQGGITHTVYNPHTNAMGKYTLYADVNQDGVYDERDYLPEDINLYCITSQSSFSCANMLAVDLATNTNCTFIGDATGGGACFVDSFLHYGLGNIYQSSSNFHSLWNQSTPTNPISVDSGVSPEPELHFSSLQNSNLFFDREYIWNKLKGNK